MLVGAETLEGEFEVFNIFVSGKYAVVFMVFLPSEVIDQHVFDIFHYSFFLLFTICKI